MIELIENKRMLAPMPRNKIFLKKLQLFIIKVCINFYLWLSRENL